jgi:hypothetical protein
MKTKRGICRILAIATMVTACLLITTQADAKKQGRRTKYKSERLHKSLNLNESQEKAIYDLNRKYAEKSKEQAKKQKEKRQKDMLAMHKSKQKELKKILTKDQYKEYEKNINKQKKDFKGNRHKRKGYKK